MGALAPVIELSGELQERLRLLVVRGVLRPRYAPVLVLEDRGSGFSPEVQGTSDSHRGAAGGKKNLVRFRRPGVFAGAMPPAPDQDLQGQVPDFFPGRVLRGLVPGVLCGSETPDKLHDDFQINLCLLVRLHASFLLCVLCRSSPQAEACAHPAPRGGGGCCGAWGGGLILLSQM